MFETNHVVTGAVLIVVGFMFLYIAKRLRRKKPQEDIPVDERFRRLCDDDDWIYESDEK